MRTIIGAEWGRYLGKPSRPHRHRFEVVRHGGYYRVRDISTKQFVSVSYHFADACERAYELELKARQRRRIFPW